MFNIVKKVIVYTRSNNISCIGEDGAGSHPLVYYHLSEDSPEDVWGYCNVTFRFDKEADCNTRYPIGSSLMSHLPESVTYLQH